MGEAPTSWPKLPPHGAFGIVRAPTPAVTPPSTREASEKNPELQVHVEAGVADPDEDLPNHRRHPRPYRRSPTSSSAPTYTEDISRPKPQDAKVSPNGGKSESLSR